MLPLGEERNVRREEPVARVYDAYAVRTDSHAITLRNVYDFIFEFVVAGFGETTGLDDHVLTPCSPHSHNAVGTASDDTRIKARSAAP